MDTGLTYHLKSLADKYENKEFLIGDPSWFMHQIEGEANKELLAFIASSLSYGSRKQFLPKIQLILDDIRLFLQQNPQLSPDQTVAQWLTSRTFARIIPHSTDSFYRLYTFAAFNDFLEALAVMVDNHGSMKDFLKNRMKGKEAIEAIEHITKWFHEQGSVGVIPKNTSSSCKRICMFLRWMVRTDSEVDLGIWADIINRSTLIIPMDTHVVQEANRLGLTNTKSTSMSAALKLTRQLSIIFPDDPTKGDFSLFGLGITNSSE